MPCISPLFAHQCMPPQQYITGHKCLVHLSPQELVVYYKMYTRMKVQLKLLGCAKALHLQRCSLVYSCENDLVCAAVGDCEIGASKKACADCTCGRAEAEAAGIKAQLTSDMLENPQSACGSVSLRS